MRSGKLPGGGRLTRPTGTVGPVSAAPPGKASLTGIGSTFQLSARPSFIAVPATRGIGSGTLLVDSNSALWLRDSGSCTSASGCRLAPSSLYRLIDKLHARARRHCRKGI